MHILTWKCASRHNGVQFFISHLASWLRARRFSEPTFRPSGAPKSLEKHSESRLLLLLSSDSVSSLIYFLRLSHLYFSSVHIVGSLTSKLHFQASFGNRISTSQSCFFFFLAATRCQCQGLATDLSIEKSAVAVTIEISLVRCCVRNCRGAAGWKLGVVVMKTWKRFLIETISVQSKIYPC